MLYCRITCSESHIVTCLICKFASDLKNTVAFVYATTIMWHVIYSKQAIYLIIVNLIHYSTVSSESDSEWERAADVQAVLHDSM